MKHFPAPASLTEKEHEAFDLLWLRRPGVTSRETLMDWMYGHSDDPPFDGVIDQFLVRLRRKLKGTPFSIKVEHGRGWYLDAKEAA